VDADGETHDRGGDRQAADRRDRADHLYEWLRGRVLITRQDAPERRHLLDDVNEPTARRLEAGARPGRSSTAVAGIDQPPWGLTA
jgi:hypothetical protein